MEANHYILLQLILLALSKWTQAFPARTSSGDVFDVILNDLNKTPNLWEPQIHFYENFAEEPIEVVLNDLESRSVLSNEIYTITGILGSGTELKELNRTTTNPSMELLLTDMNTSRPKLSHELQSNVMGVYKMSTEEPVGKDVYSGTTTEYMLKDLGTITIRRTIPNATQSPEINNTTTEETKNKPGFWQRIKSIICNDFNFTKAIEQTGSPLQPITDAIEDVQRSEAWQTASSYFSEGFNRFTRFTKESKRVLLNNLDELGDRLETKLKDDVRSLADKFNL